LPDDLKAIVTNCAYATNDVMLSEFQARSGPVLQQFVNEHGAEIRRLSDEQLTKIGETCGEVISELVEQDPLTKKVFESMNKFRTEQIAYSGTTEQDFFRARGLEYKWPS
jgi:TRAP-type mannitol/chloroaromatic compound transport system substrate-binding protein